MVAAVQIAGYLATVDAMRPARLLSLSAPRKDTMMIHCLLKPILAVTGTLSSFGLLAVDELPGWTDISATAKVSIIATLLVLISVVIVSLFLLISKERRDNTTATNQQRKDFVEELKNARKHHEQVIERVCKSFERAQDRDEHERKP
jgi:hypothetical protein